MADTAHRERSNVKFKTDVTVLSCGCVGEWWRGGAVFGEAPQLMLDM